MKIYNYQELFKDDPTDPDNVIMTFPPEIIEQTGWAPGLVLTVSVNDQGQLVLKPRDSTAENQN